MSQWSLHRWLSRPRTATRLPDFLCVGAQKSGTSTLQHHLSLTDTVYVPAEKELQYFTLNSHRPADWYAAHFAGSALGQRVGEITPYYLFHPYAAARIARLIPRAKIVILLRDPVERAISGYWHSRRLGLESLDIRVAFQSESQRLSGAAEALALPGSRHDSHQHHSYLSRSRYEQQLPRYFERFDKSQIIVMRSEDLFLSPREFWSRLLGFLEVEQTPLSAPEARLNANRQYPVSRAESAFRDFLRAELTDTYEVMSRSYGIHWDDQ